jgi:tryptophan-rich sensory protein
MKLKEFIQLILAIIICNSVGVIGSVFTISSVDTWYAMLEKPFFSPPNWLFGPVWILLYTLMGISVFLILQKGWKKKQVKRAVGIFGFQLFLNAIWTPIFFGAHMISFAFAIILLLFAAIVATMRAFFPESRTAGWLLLPYLAWVGFAAVLNGSLWLLNKPF